MKVIILGGTGFIGYHTCLELLKNGHEVATVSLSKMESKAWFPKEIKMHFKNVFELSSDELNDLFKGYDALVYCIGPDDRDQIPPPAFDYFHKKLVEIPTRIFNAARNAGIKKAVVAGSYFCYFERTRPELNLSKHPYIKCRGLQTEALIKAGKNTMDVMVLELPYIFGSMPERDPLWKDILIKMLYHQKIIFYPKGGTVAIEIQEAVKSVLGAITQGKHGKCYPIGGKNLTWNEMLSIMLVEMNMDHKYIINLPRFIMPLIGWMLKIKIKREGFEPGLDPKYLSDFMCEYFYFDPAESQQELGYGNGDVEEAIRETVRASLPL